jgi:hypothetical protein
MNTTEQSPSWEAASTMASQEIASILWNQKDNYHVHKSVPVVLILSQISPIYALPSCLRSTLTPSSHMCLSHWWSLSFRFPNQNPVCIFPSILHAPPISLLIWSPEQYLVNLSGPNIFFSSLFSYTLGL